MGKIEMFSTHRKMCGWLLCALLTLVLLVVASNSVIHFLRRWQESRANRFQAPLPAQMTGDSASYRSRIVSASGQLLTIDPTGKFLMNSVSNKPVFLTGDAPQQLATQICASDVDTYLADRQQRGFNALWVFAVDNVDQSFPPRNCNGDVPFNGADFTNFSAPYWDFVDTVIANAERRGLVVFLNPGFVGVTPPGGYLTSYKSSSSATLSAYGAFLGNRYRRFSNIVWSLGGDADPIQTKAFANLDSLAKAIQASDPNHLITFEACRSGCNSGHNKSSLDALPGPPAWLGINWVYNTQPTAIAGCQAAWNGGNTILPPMMGEDWYELEHSMTSFQIREEGYWEILSGCYSGRLFGNASIYAFNSRHAGVTSPSWQSQLDSVGSVGQAIMGKLFRSREHWKLVPDINHAVMIAGYDPRPTLYLAKDFLRELIHGRPVDAIERISVAARTSDGQTIIAYVPNGNAATITIDMSKITDATSQAKSWWFNPRDASSALIGTFAASGTRRFTPPDANDWVLVIDSAEANLAPPGSAIL